MREVKLREVNRFAQYHVAVRRQSWDWNPGLADFKQAVLEEEHLPRLGVGSGRASWRRSLQGGVGTSHLTGGGAFQVESMARSETECGDIPGSEVGGQALELGRAMKLGGATKLCQATGAMGALLEVQMPS